MWAYQTVSRHQGTLLRVLSGDKGSGLHITFGAPDQHHNDIERALRCALALRDDPQRPDFITGQQIGIASGLVFAATLGAPERHEYTVLGDEINLSARLMAATRPNTILVDDYSQERTANRFEFSPLPPLTLKGKAHPVPAFELVTERPEAIGLKARYLTSRWPLVGRETELAQLSATADKALTGAGQIILLGGRLGVGKTRLIEAVVRHWLKQGGNGFMGQCSQHLQNNPYQAWVGFWHDFFHLTPQAPADVRRAQITTVVRQLAPNHLTWVDLLADILGLPLPPQSPAHPLNAEQRRQKLFQLTLALLRGRAAQGPLLILFEDIHWADEVSAGLIDYVAANLQNENILLCLLYRSGQPLQTNLPAKSHHLQLNDLNPAQTKAMMSAILSRAVISDEVAQAMFDRTHGTPLYIEEILNHLIAAETLPQIEQSYHLTDPALLNQTPDTLQDLVRARLDRLAAETRDLAQVAAVIDREFSYDLLQTVYPYPIAAEQLQNRLEELLGQDITALTEADPNPRYIFKHALTYEVAYNSLAFARRRVLHQKTAEALENRYRHNLEEHLSALAYHYHQANLPAKALPYAVEAGERAQRLYVNNTAMQFYRQAESYLADLSLNEHWPTATRLLLNRAQLHRLKMDMTAANKDLNAAFKLAQIYRDYRSQAQVCNLRAELAYYQGQNDQIDHHARHALNLLTQLKNGAAPKEETTALYHLGVADMMAGNFAAAMQDLQRAYKQAKETGNTPLQNEALNKMATVYFFDGRLDWALKTYQQVESRRRALGLKDKTAETLSNLATVQFRLNHLQAAQQTATAAEALAREAGWQLLIPYLHLLQVEILAHTGQYAAAQQMMNRARQGFTADDEVGLAYAQLTEGREIALDLRNLNEAIDLLQQSLAVMRQYNQYEEIARSLVSLGTAQSRQKQWAAAEKHLTEARQICLQRHKSWYLAEIYTRLGDVLLKQEKMAAARQTVNLGLRVIAQRSNPDWHAPLLVLSADIARLQGEPLADVIAGYQKAAAQNKVRGRAIVQHRLNIHIGTQLLSADEAPVRAIGESLIKQGMAWLQERGEEKLALQ
jgi:predicted ATPase